MPYFKTTLPCSEESFSITSLVLGGGLGAGQGGLHWKKHHHNGYLTCNDNLLTGGRGDQVPCQHQVPGHYRKKPLLPFPPAVPLLWPARENTIDHLPELDQILNGTLSISRGEGVLVSCPPRARLPEGVPPLKDSCGKTSNFHPWERLDHY